MKTVPLVVVVFTLLVATPALAGWGSQALGEARAGAVLMPRGSVPEASVVDGAIHVSWTPSEVVPGIPVGHYAILRYGAAASPDGGVLHCESEGTHCTASAPDGEWYFTVTPSYGSWIGIESPPSSTPEVVGEEG